MSGPHLAGVWYQHSDTGMIIPSYAHFCGVLGAILDIATAVPTDSLPGRML